MNAFVVGMGVREFSLSAPDSVVKQALRSHSLRLCQAMARKVLAFDTACDIKRYLAKRRKELFE